MKKIPSYPKITAKTNITVTQTQNININSPKNYSQLTKKMFKNNNKKVKDPQQEIRSNSSTNLLKNYSEVHRKSSKKISKVICDQNNQQKEEQQMKKSKKAQELTILSEKLKKLEQKIKIIKQQEKKQKKSESSQRSHSKRRAGTSSRKKEKELISSRRDKKLQLKGFKSTPSNTKILKKTYSQKLAVKIPQSRKHGKKVSPPSPIAYNKMEEKQMDERSEQLIHRFVTQVPNQHYQDEKNLKISVQQSLRKNTYECQSQQRFSNPHLQTEQVIPELYYIESAVRSLTKSSYYSIREHITQSLQTLQFLQNIRKPTSKEIERQMMPLPPSKFQHTIILDLDETLIHCNESLHIPHDVQLGIKFPTGEKIDAGVNIRPYAQMFLEELAKICEVVVFTASHECYANVVLNYLDPHKKLISHRLFREHCWQTEQGIYIKDLRVFRTRSLDNILLVDNAAYSYYYQLDNGIPIIPFYEQKTDNELLHLLSYLQHILKLSEDKKVSLRKMNAEYFKLDKYIKHDTYHKIIEGLYVPQLHKNTKMI